MSGSDLAATLRVLHANGTPYALASVVSVSGSAPRGIGPAMAVDPDGRVSGSISGGCVDGAVYELCRQVVADGVPVRQCYESDPDDPFAPGLVCGGVIEVAVHRVDPAAEAIPADHRDGAVAPRLLLFGAVEFAVALVHVGKLLGYHVTVCDPRPIFATAERFPDADEVLVAWPHEYLPQTPVDERTVICVLTHDERIDVPVLLQALRSPAGYVGAIGSRRTCDNRAGRLRAAGLTEDDLSRLHAPIGLDLGARTPEEVALSIGAEIVAASHGGTGRPLRDLSGPLHRTVEAPRIT